jgi:hypothetical protein
MRPSGKKRKLKKGEKKNKKKEKNIIGKEGRTKIDSPKLLRGKH